MSQMYHDEALAMISTSFQETHDGLASFTDKLNSLGDVPTFWWDDTPVWSVQVQKNDFHVWPIAYRENGKVVVPSSCGLVGYELPILAFKGFADENMETALSTAEFTLFVDLASGLTIEDSAQRANLAVSTRRKQLQGMFRKLNVAGQAELISFANRLVSKLAATLTQCSAVSSQTWGPYLKYLPKGARCGIIEGANQLSVKYLDIGPVTGKPVFILHPMVFPNISNADVALFHELGWRTIWPIRPACLSMKSIGSRSWIKHSERVVSDMHALKQMFSDAPVPIVALVSSGAHATTFAESYPNDVARLDYVSTCFSAGKKKSRDVYFGDFLVRHLRQNGRMAQIAMQHIVAVVFDKNLLQSTMRRVFRGSTADQKLLDQDFSCEMRAERLKFAVRHSVESMRLDYFSQLYFSWDVARKLLIHKQFWHGVDDKVHQLEDIKALSDSVTQKPLELIPDMGHLTQGAPMRTVFRRIAEQYSK